MNSITTEIAVEISNLLLIDATLNDQGAKASGYNDYRGDEKKATVKIMINDMF